MIPEDLRGAPYLSLATFRRDGRAVATPVWFGEDGPALFVFTAPDAGKMKRLRHTARVRVARCDVRGALRGPWHDGRARILADAPSRARAHRTLLAKYGWQMRALDLLARLTGRLPRRAWLELTLDAPAAR